MELIRRNPRIFGGLGATAAAIVLLWCLWPAPKTVRAEGGYPTLDAATAASLERLRSDAGLDNDTLSALNLTPPSLETALGTLRSNFEADPAAWTNRWSALGDQHARVRTLETACQQGQDQAAALAAARQQLTQLEAEYASATATLRTTALTGLDQPQRLLAERMAGQRRLPMPLRVLDLTADQKTNLNQAAVDYHQQLAVTRDPAQRAELQTQYQQNLADILGADGLQTLATLHDYLTAASERVVAALQTVLPTTPES